MHEREVIDASFRITGHLGRVSGNVHSEAILRSIPAGGTDPVQVDLVFFRNKSRWCGVLFVESTTGYFEKPVALPALEVMVVLFSCPFIERTAPRSVDFLQPTLFNQDFQVAIDRCLIQRLDCPAAGFEDFIDVQRPVYISENLLNRIPLICFSLHPISAGSILAFCVSYCKSIRNKY